MFNIFYFVFSGHLVLNEIMKASLHLLSTVGTYKQRNWVYFSREVNEKYTSHM